MRAVKARQAIYRSPFLINRYDKGNSAIFLHLRSDISQLILALDIVINSEEKYSAYAILVYYCTEIKPVVCTTKLYYHHLSRFLIECHVLYVGVDVLLWRYRFFWLCRS